jgi:hypothetical protein
MVRFRRCDRGDEPIPLVHVDRLAGLNLSVELNPDVLRAKDAVDLQHHVVAQHLLHYAESSLSDTGFTVQLVKILHRSGEWMARVSVRRLTHAAAATKFGSVALTLGEPKSTYVAGASAGDKGCGANRTTGLGKGGAARWEPSLLGCSGGSPRRE